jgi:hypothetical protein
VREGKREGKRVGKRGRSGREGGGRREKGEERIGEDYLQYPDEHFHTELKT